MADNKRYLDLNGLGYTIRKINEKKADIESPVFTGTPKIGENNVATTADIPDVSKYIPNASKVNGQIWIQNDSTAATSEIRLLNTGGNVSFNANKQIIFESGNNITFRPGTGYKALYNGEEIATQKYVSDSYVAIKDNVLDTEIDDMLDEIIDGEGEIVDGVSFADLLARVVALESKREEEQVPTFTFEVEDATLIISEA